MLGGDRGLPPFELLSNEELAEQRQQAAGEATAAAQEDITSLQAGINVVNEEKQLYYTIALL
jgi:hypothetical protein